MSMWWVAYWLRIVLAKLDDGGIWWCSDRRLRPSTMGTSIAAAAGIMPAPTAAIISTDLSRLLLIGFTMSGNNGGNNDENRCILWLQMCCRCYMNESMVRRLGKIYLYIGLLLRTKFRTNEVKWWVAINCRYEESNWENVDAKIFLLL